MEVCPWDDCPGKGGQKNVYVFYVIQTQCLQNGGFNEIV